jgi:hypothetical protein
MDLARCYKAKDGTVYCWDKDEESWVKFRTTSVDYTQLPAEIIQQITLDLVKGDK